MEEPETDVAPETGDANEVLTPREAPPRDPMDAELPDDLTEAAIALVTRYAKAHLDKSDPDTPFSVFVVWQCHILGNRKWLISTTLPDGMYYEVTYAAGAMQFYFDAYKKFENLCIPAKRLYA